MCLTKASAPLIAKEDITCYKVVLVRSSLNIELDIPSLHGKEFTGNLLDGIQVTGKISVCDGEIYYCTNDDRLDGKDCEEKLGFKYSWKHDDNVNEITVEEEHIMKNEYITFYREAPIRIGETYTSIIDYELYSNKIEKALHSFKGKNDAINLGLRDGGVVIECIIPKGSTYHTGLFGNDNISYASDTLKYMKLIE